MTAKAELAVIGAGVVGLSTAYALRSSGVSVALYERGVPGNSQSGGESRIFRHTHEDPRLVELAIEGRGAWAQWQERFRRELLSPVGAVSLGRAAEQYWSVGAYHLGAHQEIKFPAKPCSIDRKRDPLPPAGLLLLDYGFGLVI